MIALLLASQTSVATASFAPPLDQPYRVVLYQERTQAGVTHSYELERRLVFHRDAAGLVAELTLTRVWQDIGGKSGHRFELAAGALKGRTLRFHLDPAGSVTAIDDEVAVWATTQAGIVTATAGDSRSTALARERVADTLGVSPERRRAALASPLVSLIARDAAERVAGSGPVVLAGGLVPGRSLTGTRTVTVGADTKLHVSLTFRNDDQGNPLSLERQRAIDPASGLVVDEIEVQTIGSGSTVQTVRQHVSISPVR